MRPGKQKSRTFRRIRKRTPGGRLVTHYVKRRHARQVCARCTTVLPGMTPTAKTRTAKRPERPFGGVLCSACSRREIIARARSSDV